MDLTEFWTICSTNNIVLDKKQLDDLERFADELVYWNRKINLVSRKDAENLLERHILHSIMLLKFVKIPEKSRCLDIGTGGGFPGIPLKIARPDLFMTLVDSVAKKIKVTTMLAAHTGLKNIEAVHSRTEELRQKNKNYFKHFDFAFARAVAKLNSIWPWAKSLLKKQGKLVAMKGGNIDEEIKLLKEDFPGLIIDIKPMDVFGYDKFKKDDKKIIIISRPQ